jgi:hypothetical protein
MKTYMQTLVLLFPPATGSKSKSWIITGGSSPSELHIEVSEATSFGSSDSPSGDFEGVEIGADRGL